MRRVYAACAFLMFVTPALADRVNLFGNFSVTWTDDSNCILFLSDKTIQWERKVIAIVPGAKNAATIFVAVDDLPIYPPLSLLVDGHEIVTFGQNGSRQRIYYRKIEDLGPAISALEYGESVSLSGFGVTILLNTQGMSEAAKDWHRCLDDRRQK